MLLARAETAGRLAPRLESGKAQAQSPLKLVNLLLRGSWDLVTRVIIKVTIVITTYNPS